MIDHIIVVIQVIKTFLFSSSVYSCHLFLISFASVRSLLFLPFIVPIFAQVYQETGKVAWYSHLFKKIRDTKGTLHAKMGSIKDRNGMDLTETEDIKKRWQEYREELYNKFLVTWIIMMVWSLTYCQTS